MFGRTLKMISSILRVISQDTDINIRTSHSYFLHFYFRMYASGLNPKIQELYPPVRFPVARGTPPIHSLPFWDHNDQWTPTVARSALVSLNNYTAYDVSIDY